MSPPLLKTGLSSRWLSFAIGAGSVSPDGERERDKPCHDREFESTWPFIYAEPKSWIQLNLDNKIFFKKLPVIQALEAHTCNASYLGGWGQEDSSLRPVLGK
jgi:hypothetical protein